MKIATVVTFFLTGGWAALMFVDFMLFCEGQDSGSGEVNRVRDTLRSLRYCVMGAAVLSLGLGFLP